MRAARVGLTDPVFREFLSSWTVHGFLSTKHSPCPHASSLASESDTWRRAAFSSCGRACCCDRVLPLAVACILHVSVTTPHPEGVRDMTQKWAESQVGELSRRAQAGAAARGQLEPGTFMLTMIVKNEARRLASSLPAWAPIVDFWVIGVDRNNTDDTENVIKTHLAGVPGEILIVDFDGMGPTWTKVVEHGLKKYPQATHGILADADFTPLPQTLSKWDLDTGCSKLQFTVLEADGTGTRVMDWIYRNIPGVRVERRTHQILLVPRTSNQPTYQRQIGFTVKEFAGGYQDRAGNKSGRYIDWLLKDLEEMPGDSRTIYYLAKEHMELIGPNPVADLRAVPPGPGAYHLRKSLEYYQMRARIGSLLGEGVDEEVSALSRCFQQAHGPHTSQYAGQ